MSNQEKSARFVRGVNCAGLATPDLKYTYIHRREADGTPFYVGKGTGDRAWRRSGRSSHWRSIVAKHGLVVDIVALHQSDEAAFDDEIRLIANARAAGVPIINRTIGGDGVRGVPRTPGQIAKQQASLQAWLASLAGIECRRAHSERLRGDQEAAQRLREGMLRHFADKANRNAVGERMRAYYSSPDIAEITRQRARIRAADPGRQAQQSAAHGGAPILHVESGAIFDTQGQAARALGIRQSSISQVLSGRNKTAGGHTFQFAKEPA